MIYKFLRWNKGNLEDRIGKVVEYIQRVSPGMNTTLTVVSVRRSDGNEVNYEESLPRNRVQGPQNKEKLVSI